MFSKSAWERLFDWCFGYDFFVSYSRIDWSEDYAVRLADALSRPPFEFRYFLDAKTMETDKSWRVQGRRALRKSSKILLLLTPGVLRSPGVRDELEFNRTLGRDRKPITLIDIGDTWDKHICADVDFVALLSDRDSARDIIRIDEDHFTEPSESVLRRIQSNFKLRSENAKRTYILAIIAIVLLVLAGAAGVLSVLAREQRNVAVERQAQAQTNQSLLLATLSDEQRANNRPEASLFLALKALPVQTWAAERPLVNEAMNSLLLSERSFSRPQTILTYAKEGPGDGGVEHAHFGFDDRQIVTETWYGRIQFWNSSTGALIADTGTRYEQGATAALSADAPFFVISSGSGNHSTIDVWNIAQGKLAFSLEAASKTLRFAFGGIGRVTIVTQDGQVEIWDLARGQKVSRLRRNLNDNLAVTFADPQKLVTFSKGGLVETWNADDGTLLSSFDTRLGFVDRADLSAHGEIAVVFRARNAKSLKIDRVRNSDSAPWREEKSCSPCVAEVWDLGTGTRIGEIGEHSDSVFPLVRISSTNETIAVRDPANDEKQVLLWSTKSRKIFATLSGHQSRITDIAFSKDGALIAASSWDRTARVWSTISGAPIAVFRGHSDYTNCVDFNHLATRLLSGSTDGTTRVWALADSAVIANLEHPSGHLSAVAFSPDGTLLAVAGGKLQGAGNVHHTISPLLPFVLSSLEEPKCEDKCVVRIWNSATWKTEFDFLTEGSPQAILVFRPGGKLLLTAPGGTSRYSNSRSAGAMNGSKCEICTANVWNMKSGSLEYQISVPRGVISDAKFSPDGSMIAVATDAGAISLFQADTGAKIADLPAANPEPTKTIAFDPSGHRLLAPSWDKSIYLWNLETRKTIAVFAGQHEEKVGDVQFDDTGMRFLSSSADGTTRLWDIETKKAPLVFRGHASAVNQAIFAQTGSLIVTTSDDNSIGVWPADDPSRVRFLRGHVDTGAFSGVQRLWNLQGNRILTFGSDGALRIWDISRVVAEDVVTPPDGVATGAALSPKEDKLAVMRRDGSVQIRRIDTTDAFQQIDIASASLYPVLDSDIGRLSGLDANDSQEPLLKSHAGEIKAASRAFDAISAQGLLSPTVLEQYANAGAIGAHIELAKRYEANSDLAVALAQAFLHHRIAERLFNTLEQSSNANFEAARRVSLASTLNKDDLAKYWRLAQSWAPAAGAVTFAR